MDGTLNPEIVWKRNGHFCTRHTNIICKMTRVPTSSSVIFNRVDVVQNCKGNTVARQSVFQSIYAHFSPSVKD